MLAVTALTSGDAIPITIPSTGLYIYIAILYTYICTYIHIWREIYIYYIHTERDLFYICSILFYFSKSPSTCMVRSNIYIVILCIYVCVYFFKTSSFVLVSQCWLTGLRVTRFTQNPTRCPLQVSASI